MDGVIDEWVFSFSLISLCFHICCSLCLACPSSIVHPANSCLSWKFNWDVPHTRKFSLVTPTWIWCPAICSCGPVHLSTAAFTRCPLFLEKDLAGGRYFGWDEQRVLLAHCSSPGAPERKRQTSTTAPKWRQYICGKPSRPLPQLLRCPQTAGSHSLP